ncbi:MAG: hypothetical protein ACLU4J_08920 [Butyricimonas paravirosa]
MRYVAEQTLKVDADNEMANSILAEGSDELKDGNTDWAEELEQPYYRHDLNLSVRGGEITLVTIFLWELWIIKV